MLIALLVCIVGLLLFLLLNAPEMSKLAEAGKIMFGVGLFIVLWPVASERVESLTTLSLHSIRRILKRTLSRASPSQ